MEIENKAIIVRYRGYKMRFAKEPDGWFGKVIGIKDLVTTYASTIYTLQREAEMAIDDYVETCQEMKGNGG